MRTFIAIDVPGEIRKNLARISGELAGLGLDGRRTRVESIHLTLIFLGEIDAKLVEPIERIMLECRTRDPFEVQFAGLGAFPHLGRPRVVWAGVRHSPPLKLLQKELETRLAGLGFSPERRPFQPHLTLMRLKSQKNTTRLVSFISGEKSSREIGSYQVTEFHLYQSLLKPDGAEYRKLVSVPLEQESRPV